MPVLYLAIISWICTVVLIILLNRKQVLDTTELEEQKRLVANTKAQLNQLNTDCDNADKRLQKLLNEYKEASEANQEDLDAIFNEQRQRRQQQLDDTFEEKRLSYKLILADVERSTNQKIFNLNTQVKQLQNAYNIQKDKYDTNIQIARTRFESILEPMRRYEQEQQEKLFYTIQIPEEYHEDIDFLLTTVAQKVQHPDIISKLVWAEYVKPHLEDTFKRIGIKSQPGIYKITNINTNKAYIGKSTNVKTRIADHFKSSVGITSIADQAVHHAMLKEGLWNWTIEIITYCEKDQLSQLEKYYIDFFQTQIWGYNKKQGG